MSKIIHRSLRGSLPVAVSGQGVTVVIDPWLSNPLLNTPVSQVGPVDVMARMSAVLGHVGAWAPRAEQVATAQVLSDAKGVAAFHASYLRQLQARLDLLHRGLQEMKQAGLPVDSMAPMGAIYLTARLHPFGRKTPQGAPLRTNEDVRRYVLDAASLGVVPFQAFGARDDAGWFRMSVGAVGERDIAEALPRLAAALRATA